MRTLKVISFLLIIAFVTACNKTHTPKSDAQKAKDFFEMSDQMLNNQKIYDFNMNGHILLVDSNRQAWSNTNIKGFNPGQEIYLGNVPFTVDSGTSRIIDWNEQKWAVISSPLPQNTDEQKNLLAHTMAQYHQDKQGFDKIKVTNCTHLQKTSNRILMKIEARALEQALKAENNIDQTEHIRLAVAAKKMRSVSVGKDFIRETHNELKIGTPHLISMILNENSYENNKQKQLQLLQNIQNSQLTNNMFAKALYPTYGLLMSQKDTMWINEINYKTNIIDFVIDFYNFEFYEDFFEIRDKMYKTYNASEFEEQEKQITKKQQVIDDKYQKKFLDGDFLFIKIDNNTQYQYNTEQSIPFLDRGTVCKNVQASGPWGKLLSADEVLFNYNFSYMYFAPPFEIHADTIKGKYWTLVLENGYSVKKYRDSDKYHVSR